MVSIASANGKFTCSRCGDVRTYSVVLPYTKNELLRKLDFRNTRYGIRCKDKNNCQPNTRLKEGRNDKED